MSDEGNRSTIIVLVLFALILGLGLWWSYKPDSPPAVKEETNKATENIRRVDIIIPKAEVCAPCNLGKYKKDGVVRKMRVTTSGFNHGGENTCVVVDWEMAKETLTILEGYCRAKFIDEIEGRSKAKAENP